MKKMHPGIPVSRTAGRSYPHKEVAAIWSKLEEEHLDLEDVVTRALTQEQFAAVQVSEPT